MKEKVNKPSTIDFRKDFTLIHVQYDKEFDDFFEDYETLAYERFYGRVYMLNGVIGDIIQLRTALINGQEMDKDRRKAAYSVATPEILEYINDKRDEAIVHETESILSAVAQAFGGK